MARAIGSPLSDYHGLVSRADAGLDAAEVLRAADLTAYRYTGLIDPHGVFGPGRDQDRPRHRPAGGDAGAYLEAVRAASPKKIKNWRRLDSKLEREMGAIELVAADRSREAFDQLIAWKREQLERTGVHDFLRPDWVRGLLTDLFQKQTGPFQGLMINLYAGGQLVAGHFGVRLNGVYHPWIASTNPAYGEWSPGQIFFMRAIAAMPGLGLHHYDLGPGHDHYKGAYALSQVQIGDGTATAATMAGRVAQLAGRRAGHGRLARRGSGRTAEPAHGGHRQRRADPGRARARPGRRLR
jgi:CelD/BcsL family acetyltransferase involved in cellulose biosynthesis